MHEAPYLSVVVTSRNDDHGRNLLQRTQTFLDGLAGQSNRHRLPTELVLVEWNPPLDRPSLVDVLRWPSGGPFFEARVITVPAELHQRLEHSARLPLFQMIAKNVGIRRARGAFVLATNIDLLFSDELMEHLASRSLDPRRLYRVDRYDVAEDVPLQEPLPDQLAWCDSDGNVIRICRRDGTLELATGVFHRIYENVSVPLWATPWLRILRLITRVPVRAVKRIEMEAVRVVHASRRGWDLVRRLTRGPRAPRRTVSPPRVHGLAWHIRRIVTTRARALRRAALRESRRLVLVLRLLPSAPTLIHHACDRWRDAVRSLFVDERARMRLHTNACGDFTLMAREAWERAGGYPELEIFSMHIDSLMLYQAHYVGIRERYLPWRVYHIEHDDGFKPDEESLERLNGRLERSAIPQLSNAEFLDAVVEMYRSGRPKFVNTETWGFAAETLPELTTVARQVSATPRRSELQPV